MMKKKVAFMVEEDVWETFKQAVIAKHGKLHTCLGDEAARAFVSWVSSGGRTRVRTNYPNPRHKRSVDTAREIYHELCNIVPNDHVRVARPQVEKAIGVVVSCDSRNYRKYFPMLLSLGFLSETRGIGVYAICERVAAEAEKNSGGRVPEAKLLGNAREKLQGAR